MKVSPASRMQAVVMAGGAGSRLRPLTVGRPKPIVPIANKPVIGHIRDLLCRHNILDLVITLQYMPDQIQDYLGDGSDMGMRIEYSVEEQPLGTAGSVKNAADKIVGDFLVISGDAVTDVNLTDALRYHREHGGRVTMVLHYQDEPPEYGVVTMDGEGRVIHLQEKPSWSEVASDTVNTGIYVLDRSVLDDIPAETPYDFAKDLFPRLLEAGEAIYGYVSHDYWTDVGTLQEYMRANADVLNRLVKGVDLGRDLGGGIWVEGDVDIAPNAQLYGPIYLGNGVKIKDGVVVQGPSVIRAFSVIDNHAYIDRSIIWRNCYIGEGAEVRGAIIGRSCNLKNRTAVFEGAVIGDGTSVEEGAIIHSGVKIWPGKAIDQGSNVKNSIIWGSQGRRTLFSRFGVSGLVNVDLTPDFAARLGAAYGSILPQGAQVVINRDLTRAARMLKRAIIAGLPSAGVHVYDADYVPIPVMRYYVSNDKAAGAIHVRMSPFDSRVVDIRFYDGEGMNLSRSVEREIERVFFREDYRRVYLDEIGAIYEAPFVVDRYTTGFKQALDADALREAQFNVVVDCANAPTSNLLPALLSDLGCKVVALNAQLDEHRMSILKSEFESEREQLGKISYAVKADVGVRLDVGGERIFLVDDQGRQVNEAEAARALAWLAWREHPGGVVVVPVTASHAFETIAEELHGAVWRTRFDQAEMMKAARHEEVVLAVDGLGNTVIPAFQPTIDGLFGFAKLLEYLAHQGLSLSEVVDQLPDVYRDERRVDLRWETRGKLMRQLHERFLDVRDPLAEGVQLAVGEREWVLILPSPDEPYISVFGEADSDSRARTIAEDYAQLVRELLAGRDKDGANGAK